MNEKEREREETGRGRCYCGCMGVRKRWPLANAGPLKVLAEREGWEVLEDGSVLCPTPRWLDHRSVEDLPDGRKRYIAEPYQLNADDMRDLIHLSENGFKVTVTAWEARHYPGHTLFVCIEERREAP